MTCNTELSFLDLYLSGDIEPVDQGDAQTQREYIWLDDIPVAVVDNVQSGSPVIYYVHVDHLMRPARMTAQDTSWVWDVIYAPFGGVSYIWSNPANIDLRFPGQWFQLESGLAYNWHRHYDATLGRYVQADPLGLKAMLSDGPSVYGYVGGNPLAYADSSGESFWLTIRPFLRIPRLFKGPGSPPPGDPLPPGWTPDWMWRFPDLKGCPRWFDPRGGEWRLHRPDKWHPDTHWDYNPWDAWNSPWRNLDLKGNKIRGLTAEQFEQCRIAGMCT